MIAITKWDLIYYKVWQMLQSVTRVYYHVWQVLENATIFTNWDVTPVFMTW